MRRLQAEVVTPRLHRHDHFFERAIAGALAQSVDRAFHLPCAADGDAGQRVGHRHAQVVVAMHRPHRLVAVGDALAQVADELPVQLGDRISDGVGDVQRGRAFGYGRFEHAAQEVGVGAVAVLGRELDICAQVARKAHRQPRLLQDLLARHAQLLLHVQITGGDEGVDARRRSPLQGLGGTRDVAVVGARQRAHGGLADVAGDGLDRLEVAVARCGKAGFDDIDAQALQLARDAQLFVLGHRRARRLLAVAQGGVEDDQLVAHGQAFRWSTILAAHRCAAPRHATRR